MKQWKQTLFQSYTFIQYIYYSRPSKAEISEKKRRNTIFISVRSSVSLSVDFWGQWKCLLMQIAPVAANYLRRNTLSRRHWKWGKFSGLLITIKTSSSYKQSRKKKEKSSRKSSCWCVGSADYELKSIAEILETGWRFIFVGTWRCPVRWSRNLVRLQRPPFAQPCRTARTSSDPAVPRSDTLLSRELPNIGAGRWNRIRQEHTGTADCGRSRLEFTTTEPRNRTAKRASNPQYSSEYL